MIYLNQPEDGGATRFKTIGKTVQPETGKLLAWNNLLPDGRPNPATLHQGMKVRRGTKYVLTKWFRELARQRRRRFAQRSSRGRSPDWSEAGAGEGIRTLDPNLGKVGRQPSAWCPQDRLSLLLSSGHVPLLRSLHSVRASVT